MIYKLKICDICKAEERSDVTKYWADYFSSEIVLDFKSAPSIQTTLKYDCLCRNCARALFDGICKTVKGLYKEGSNGPA